MSDPGNSQAPGGCRIGGFTLLELMLVVAIVAMAGAGVGFALRDGTANQLEREGQRLAAMLDAARSQSRASGAAAFWLGGATGFEILSLGSEEPVRKDWLVEGTVVSGATRVMLGPEPIIEAQQIVLRAGRYSVRVETDGLRPFAVVVDAQAAQRAP